MTPPIPQPNVYLRNRFEIARGGQEAFLAGKAQLLSHTRGSWSLIAGAGRQSFLLGRPLPEPQVPLMQVWHLKGWNTLYDTMYTLSDAPWYAGLVHSLAREDQDLLVDLTTGFGISPRPLWHGETEPGYVYFSEDVVLAPGATPNAYARDLNWLASRVEPFDWHLQWAASAITSRPSAISVLWRAPDTAKVETALSLVANDAGSRDRYAHMMSLVQHLAREHLYPICTEWLADHIPDSLARAPRQGVTP
jgi:hypothetical protein